MKIYRFLAVLVSSLILSSTSVADVIYENGTFTGDFGAVISPPQSISNSFDVTQRSLLTSATLGLLSPTGSEPLSLTYSIGLAPFGTEIDSGNVVLTNQPGYVTGDFSVFLSSFFLNIILDPGTYFLTLSNGVSTGNLDLAWLINGGPSQASFRNSINGEEGSLESEYFLLEGELVDDPAPVPEPSTIFISLTGLTTMFVIARRRSGLKK